MYIYIYIPTYLPTYIPTYLHTYIHTDRQTDIHVYVLIHIYIYISNNKLSSGVCLQIPCVSLWFAWLVAVIRHPDFGSSPSWKMCEIHARLCQRCSFVILSGITGFSCGIAMPHPVVGAKCLGLRCQFQQFFHTYSLLESFRYFLMSLFWRRTLPTRSATGFQLAGRFGSKQP